MKQLDMLKLSEGTKNKLLADSYMERCAACGKTGTQWHHVMFWGRQLDLWWAIVPACPECHKLVDTNKSIDEDGNVMRELFQWVAILRMPLKMKAQYRKYDWDFERRRLDRKFVENYWFIALKIQHHY